MSGKRIFCSVLIGLFLLGGCAAPPREAIQGARKAVAEAYINEAHLLAPDQYQAAREALQEGEQLLRQKKYESAEEVLAFAESHARRAELLAREEQARRAEEEERRQRAARLEREREPAPTSPPAIIPAPPKTKRPLSETSPPPPPPTEPPPQPEAVPATRYTVTNGETLWTIAAHREIYRDALLWPLIYRANRDQIKDPRQIYPGQVLNIPRDLSAEEREEARRTARQSDIFPLQDLIGKGAPEATEKN